MVEPTALTAHSVEFAYKPGLPVISDFSFSFAAGECVGIWGANASGKTTLLHLLAGLLRPESGEILLREKRITSIPPKQRARIIALVPSEFLPAFPFTVQAVCLSARSLLVPDFFYENRAEMERTEQLLSEVGLDKKVNEPVHNLSGGERQWVSITRGLLQDTPILLLDEPTAHLDYPHRLILARILSRWISEQKRVLIFTAHDFALLPICHRMLGIKQGRVVCVETANSFQLSSFVHSVLDFEVEKGGFPLW